MNKKNKYFKIKYRFCGFYPVVIDIETAGFNPKTNAILEISANTIKINKKGWMKRNKNFHFHIKPFSGSKLKKKSLNFNKIDPLNPFRLAVKENIALNILFNYINKKIKQEKCKKAIVVAHNASFDHTFLMNASNRIGCLKNPFHSFVTFDTASLSGLILGETVLAKACIIAGIKFSHKKAHSALYDCKKTAKLFCKIVNRLKKLGGCPLMKKNFYHKKL